MKEITIIAYTHLGGQLAHSMMMNLRARQYLACAYLFEKYTVSGCISFSDGKAIIKESFKEKKPILFIGATGIAVRLVAPFVNSKVSDSPVIVMDEKGQYAIPILSGHLGGANEYARLFASLTNGLPIITTATDIHQKFAVDLFAKKNQLYITDMEKAKRISASVLQGEDWKSQYIISPYIDEETDKKLLLVPKQLVVGIGCKKGTSVEQIEQSIEEVFQEKGLHLKGILRLCSIDLKKEEAGILAYCEKYEIPYETFSAKKLMEVAGEFTASSFVKSVTGVDNVCERSALAGCNGLGEVIVPKQKKASVTIAIAKISLPKLIDDWK